MVGAGGAVLGHAAEVQINQNIGAYAPNYQYGNQTNNVSDYLWSAGTGAVSGALGKVFSEVLPRQMKLPLNVSDKIYNDAIRYGLFQEGSKFALDQNLAIIQDTLFDPMASAIGRYATSSLTQSSKSSTCNSTEASLGMPLQNANSTPAFLY